MLNTHMCAGRLFRKFMVNLDSMMRQMYHTGTDEPIVPTKM